MNAFLKSTLIAPLALAAALAVGGACAQSAEAQKEVVLKEGQITEAVLKAFAITRNWTPAVAGSTAAAAAPPTARASILITFVTASADLTPQAKQSLDVLAGAMKSNTLEKVKFTIEGHADPRGKEDANMKLSQARAESVRDYLTGSHGLAAERVNAVGKGSSVLMKPGVPAAPENRRVTIVAQPRT